MRIRMDIGECAVHGHESARAEVGARDEGSRRWTGRPARCCGQVQLMALDESGGEIFAVTVDAEPKVSVGEFVRVEGLVAMPWSQGDRSGVAFRAALIGPLNWVEAGRAGKAA